MENLKRTFAVAVALIGLLVLAKPAKATTTTLTVVQMTKGGVSRSSATLTTGVTYQFPNDGNTFLHIEKKGASAATVTVTTPGTFQGLAIADVTYSVPASTGSVYAGPFNTGLFNDGNGYTSFTIDEGTAIYAEVLHL